MEYWEEEIRNCLSHSIRRSIIELLMEKESLSFSDLLKCLSLRDHGKLGFHLRTMKNLVEIDPSKRKYHLTRMGQIAGEILWDSRFLIAKGGKGIRHEPVRYVRQLSSTDHAILFHDTKAPKREVIFNFLLSGLLRKNAVMYIVPENELNQEFKEAICYGINVDYVRQGAFKVVSTEDWYMRKGKTDADTIMSNWQKCLEENRKAGFAGLSAAAYMNIYYENNRKELLKYEASLGKSSMLNIRRLCIYDKYLVEKDKDILALFHGHAILNNIAFKMPKSSAKGDRESL